jgi:hypothetical protein
MAQHEGWITRTPDSIRESVETTILTYRMEGRIQELNAYLMGLGQQAELAARVAEDLADINAQTALAVVKALGHMGYPSYAANTWAVLHGLKRAAGA